MSGSKVIRIQSFLGIESAEIPLPDTSPSGVTGPNASGKTSVATAVAGLLSRTPNPLGLSSGQPYINDRADSGEVAMFASDGTELSRWVPGEKSVRVFAECPEGFTLEALALVDFVSPSRPSERTAIWEPILLPPPETLAEKLEAALTKLVPREKQRLEIMDSLRIKGWIDAEKTWREKARDAKRDWQGVTGESYGSKKGVSWRPSGWLSHHEGVTVLDATSALEAAREAKRALDVTRAVSEADVEKAKRAEADLPDAKAKLDAAREEFNAQQNAVQSRKELLRDIRKNGVDARRRFDEHKLNRPEPDDACPCPYEDCGRPVVVMEDGSLQASDPATHRARLANWETGLRERSKALEALRAQAAPLQKQLVVEQDKLARLEGVRNGAQAVVNRLQEDIDASKGELVTNDSESMEARVARAEQSVATAQKDLDIVTSHANAQDYHASVAEYEAIAMVLGPRGVRAREIEEKKAALHEHLETMSKLAGWPLVELDKAYAVYLNQRAAAVSAESEKWRAQFMLQAAVGMMQGAPLLIADGADILDVFEAAQFAVLCDELAKQGLPTLVCATARDGKGFPWPEHWDVGALL